MLAAQAGDARAYDRLLRAALPLLRGIAGRRIADAAEAEDAVQDTLLTLHRIRHSWDPTRPVRPWLATLCERRCIDRLRRAQALRRAVPLRDLSEHATAEPARATGELAAAELRRAIATLPRAQRDALTLAKLAELPVAEAAARSGLTPGSVKVATHRAIRSLRRILLPRAA
ncbi:sigma-70 family RNA polymerase sigma factor [Dankookia rubra]|uniref:Sigma-70 family RNA polymerase sigma factor n=2 Tax=Dankookia rubra TaxID=1442381 RepID=A0A4R5QB14_9PROT|nr:sigma-70 family RNA polymerase sigma factor [Dankookia rubra]